MMLNSKAGPFSCPVCNQRFRNKRCLQRHLKRHFSDNSYVCQICASGFPSRAELVLHRRTHWDGKLYKCSECSRAFRRRDSLLSHVSIHWNVDFKCDLCDKTFKSESSLDVHHKIHIGERPYQCDLCDSTFACKEHLNSHKKKVHNLKNILYQCDVCKKIFKSSVGLRLHRISHSTDRPHICHLCPETFKHQGSLREHLRRHVCPKPYICPICSKAFGSSAGVNEHKVIHSSSRDFQCETCGKSYRRKTHLDRHIVSHGDEKRYACKYCGKRFKYRRAMNVHIRSHTGQRPYACDLCGHRFSQMSRMKSHRMTHTGEKPYKCIACNKAFCRHDKLTDHCRRMHKQLFDMNKALSSTGYENLECKSGTSNNSTQSDTIDELDTKCKPGVVDAKNNSAMNPNQTTEVRVPVTKRNALTRSYLTRSECNPHENGDVKNDILNSRRGRSVIATNGEEDCNMSLKIEVFDETELTDDFYLDDAAELLTDVRDDEQESDVRQFVKTITRQGTSSKEELRKLKEQNDDESSSMCDNLEVMDSDDATEIIDGDDVTVHILEEEEIEEATDGVSAAAKKGVCFWSDSNSIQDDEDFLFAMRVFQLLKSHPPGLQKDSLKAQVEDMLLDAEKSLI